MEKTEKMRIRITAEERQYIDHQSEVYGVSVSECVRRMIDKEMGKMVDMPETKSEFQQRKDLIYEMNRIGTNVNQIAKNVNARIYSEYEKKKLFALMKKLEALMSEKL